MMPTIFLALLLAKPLTIVGDPLAEPPCHRISSDSLSCTQSESRDSCEASYAHFVHDSCASVTYAYCYKGAFGSELWAKGDGGSCAEGLQVLKKTGYANDGCGGKSNPLPCTEAGSVIGLYSSPMQQVGTGMASSAFGTSPATQQAQAQQSDFTGAGAQPDAGTVGSTVGVVRDGTPSAGASSNFLGREGASVIDEKTIVIVVLLGVLFCVVCILPCFCMREAYECLCGPGSWGPGPGCGGYNGTEMAAAGLAGAAAGYYMGDQPGGYPGGYGGYGPGW